MMHYDNATARHTGISDPHSIMIDGIWVSISRGDYPSSLKYYTKVQQMKQVATATDQKGRSYDIYSDTDDIPTSSKRIAIPTPKKKEAKA